MISTLKNTHHVDIFTYAIKYAEIWKKANRLEDYCDVSVWLGRAYLAGWCNTKACVETATRYFYDAARNGCFEAWTILAAGHCEGWIQNANFAHGVSLYVKAMSLGCPFAHKELGDIYFARNDVCRALEIYLAGGTYCKGNRDYLAFAHCELAAARDNGTLSDELACLSKHPKKTDLASAMEGYYTSYRWDYFPATLTLAVHWEQLFPTPHLYISPHKDVEIACTLYRKAMESGSIAACVSLCAKMWLINASKRCGYHSHLSENLINSKTLDFCDETNEFFYLNMAMDIIASSDEDPCFPKTTGPENELLLIKSAVARGQLLFEYRLVAIIIEGVLVTMPVIISESERENKEYRQALESLMCIIKNTISLTPPLKRHMRRWERAWKRKSHKKRERRKRTKVLKKQAAQIKNENDDENPDALLAAMLQDIELIDPLTGEFYDYSSDSLLYKNYKKICAAVELKCI
jgi:hypothetical protein